MARINVEDRWWNDPRRRTLRLLLKRDCAEQVAVNAWRTGYDYWCDRSGCSLIPGAVFIHFDGYQELIQSGLAVIYTNTRLVDPINFRTRVEHLPTDPEHNSTDPNIIKHHHVYLCGMREALLNLMVERTKKSVAGKKSAAKRLLLYGSAQPKPEHPRTQGNTPELSYSPSPSPSLSSSNSNSLNTGVTPTPPKRRQRVPVTNDAWQAYAEAFLERWHTDPVRNATVNSQLANLLKRVPSEEVPTLIRFYLKSDKPFYVQQMHKIGLLLQDAETVYAQMKAGIKIVDTRTNGQYPSKHQQSMDAFEKNKQIVAQFVASAKGVEHEN